ncbi:hypothetical protein EAE32_10860 [Kocuria tytonicola]|uniref:DNA-directed RNA polymerase subunit beta n=1 Tax=Kocuria tytonicola TaxID=2055946 RepID=A0A3L9KZJ7_9MICC|nr:hypothetical protein [Kocuria tytonicola]RLY91711.1 hypothetical protein EAE32_10860 [Kocuria tytonicola]
MPERRTHHSPVKFSPEKFEAHEGGTDPARVSEAAHLAAQALVSRGRRSRDPEVRERLVRLTDEQGLEGIAELWAEAPALSLPGALWRLYALRAAARTDPWRMSRWFAAGRHAAQVSHVVAGVADPPGAEEICEVADTILSGAFHGEFDVALERFAAFCRVIAVGQEHTLDVAGLRTRDPWERIPRLLRTAEELEAAAEQWRRGHLE